VSARGPERRGGGAQNVVQGLVLLGRGREEGLRHFEATREAMLAGLAPWVAFLLVGGAMMVLRDHPVAGADLAALSLCSLLLPPVISEGLARVWRREGQWLRYATASLWCAWLMPLAYLVGLLGASIALAAGLPPKAAPYALCAVLGGYWLWLHFFLARAGLGLTRLRATLLVAAVVGGYAVLVAIAGAFDTGARLLVG
jgi:hypothetical protein